MDATADNMTGFTGVLVGRRWKPGQKYIQLVFETTEGFKLSLSRNLRMVRSLSMGNTYRVEGRKYVLGEKVVIKEPSATLVESNRSFFGQNKILISAVIAVTITGISGGVLLAKQGSGSNKSNAQTVKNQAQQSSQNSKAADTTPAETSPQPGSTGDNQTPATPAAAPATSKKTAKSTPSISSQPQAQPITDPAPLPASTTDQQPTDPLPSTPPPTPPPDPSPPPDSAPAPDPGTTDPTAGG
jgi:hypothetical protein